MIIIPSEYFALFEKLGSTKTYLANELIFMSEDAADSIYLIESGRVRVYIPGLEGKETTLQILKKGRIFGDASFVQDAVRSVNIEAVVPSVITEVRTSSLLPALHDNEELMILMFRHLTEQNNFLTHKLARMIYCNAEQKVADQLLALTAEGGSSIPFSHENLAETLGMNRVTVTKILKKFVSQGCVETGYGVIKVTDRRKLSSILPKDSMYFIKQ